MKRLACGLIGANIGRSRLSRALATMAEDHGVAFSFTAIDTQGDPTFDFDAQVDRLRQAGWTGVSVTHPWKRQAAAWAGGTMAAGTADLGAANTLTFAPTGGHNTDFSGFGAAFPHVLDRVPGRVAVAGAGGVARAAIPALIAMGAESVHVWDRDAGLARETARATGATAIEISDAADAIAQADGLANCTPMGMEPYGGSAFDAAGIGPQAWAFDAVYTPTDTSFLLAAKAAGLAILTGFDLFRFMAIGSFEAYTGIAPDAEKTFRKLDELRPR